MTRFFYSVLFYLAVPLVIARVYWRAQKEPRYRENLAQRFGRIREIAPHAIWVHAVSAGETIAAVGLVKSLVNAGHKVVLSNMTPAGRERAEALFAPEVASGCLTIVYAPYDLPIAVRHFLELLKPRALIVIDTELWPNTIHQANKMHVPVFVVNGRLSAKSTSGYKRISALSKPMFRALTCVFAQTESQTTNFRLLGAADVVTAGSIKFDATLPDDFAQRAANLQARFTGRKVVLAASTHDGEEQVLVEAFERFAPVDGLLILAPRHTHRTESIEKWLQAKHLKYQNHSKDEVLELDTRVYLLDTMGELIYFYGICMSAFVGGSLVDNGGHNPMEPGMLGKPIMMGPYRRNIADIAEQFEQSGALRTVRGADDIVQFWEELTQTPDLASTIEVAAAEVMTRNQGALGRVLEVILPRLGSTNIEPN